MQLSMKKILLSLTLVLAIAIISGYKPSGKNEAAEKQAKQDNPKNFKGTSNPDISEYKANRESVASEKKPAGKPKILLMLTNETGQASWSPSLWWNYEYGKPGQPGC